MGHRHQHKRHKPNRRKILWGGAIVKATGMGIKEIDELIAQTEKKITDNSNTLQLKEDNYKKRLQAYENGTKTRAEYDAILSDKKEINFLKSALADLRESLIKLRKSAELAPVYGDPSKQIVVDAKNSFWDSDLGKELQILIPTLVAGLAAGKWAYSNIDKLKVWGKSTLYDLEKSFASAMDTAREFKISVYKKVGDVKAAWEKFINPPKPPPQGWLETFTNKIKQWLPDWNLNAPIDLNGERVIDKGIDIRKFEDFYGKDKGNTYRRELARRFANGNENLEEKIKSGFDGPNGREILDQLFAGENLGTLNEDSVLEVLDEYKGKVEELIDAGKPAEPKKPPSYWDAITDRVTDPWAIETNPGAFARGVGMTGGAPAISFVPSSQAQSQAAPPNFVSIPDDFAQDAINFQKQKQSLPEYKLLMYDFLRQFGIKANYLLPSKFNTSIDLIKSIGQRERMVWVPPFKPDPKEITEAEKVTALGNYYDQQQEENPDLEPPTPPDDVLTSLILQNRDKQAKATDAALKKLKFSNPRKYSEYLQTWEKMKKGYWVDVGIGGIFQRAVNDLIGDCGGSVKFINYMWTVLDVAMITGIFLSGAGAVTQAAAFGATMIFQSAGKPEINKELFSLLEKDKKSNPGVYSGTDA